MNMTYNTEREFLCVLIAEATRFGVQSLERPTVREVAEQVSLLLGQEPHEHYQTYITIYRAYAEKAWILKPLEK